MFSATTAVFERFVGRRSPLPLREPTTARGNPGGRIQSSLRKHDHFCNPDAMDTFPFLANVADAVGAPATSWDVPGIIFLKLLAVVFLVLLNGFFVASEFAIVKVRATQLDARAAPSNGRARLARHVTSHLDSYLSATQLGI